MGGGVLKTLLSHVDDAAMPKLSYRTANKELKQAIDYRLAKQNEDFIYRNDMDGEQLFSEGGTSDIPRIHVDDLKEFGYDTEIPTRYKRRTGKRDIDELAGFAGFTEAGGDQGIDGFLESILKTLDTRKANRARALEISEMRNNPDFIRETQKIVDDERARYGTPDPEVPVYEPTKRDYQWYVKNVAIPKSKVHQIEVKTPDKTGMENFKINRNDISYSVPESVIRYIPSNHQIPVRNLTPQPAPQPAAAAAPVVPLTQSQPQQYMPGWKEILANTTALRASMGEA